MLLLAVRTWAGTIVASVAFAATTLWFAADTAASQSSTAGLIMLGIPMYGWIPSAVVAAVERRLAVDHR
ncbi:MAG: hypothetical protein JJU45_16210 [Acidimicrobiia bacterium]|nr:hypothetical protein [Acidimicrobiia bacterium]